MEIRLSISSSLWRGRVYRTIDCTGNELVWYYICHGMVGSWVTSKLRHSPYYSRTKSTFWRKFAKTACRCLFGGAECTILWVPSIMGLLRHVHSWGVPLGHISLRSTPRSYESKSEPFLTQSEYDWESTILRINFYTSLSSTYYLDRAFWSELYNRALQSIAFGNFLRFLCHSYPF